MGALAIAFLNSWQIAFLALATGPLIFASSGITNIFLHKCEEKLQDVYEHSASVAEEVFAYISTKRKTVLLGVFSNNLLDKIHNLQALSNIRTLYAFTNEALAKRLYASSLQDTLKCGILVSLVQGLGLGFTYGFGMCSCALQLWVGRFLVTNGKCTGAEIITAIFAIILSGLYASFLFINFFTNGLIVISLLQIFK